MKAHEAEKSKAQSPFSEYKPRELYKTGHKGKVTLVDWNCRGRLLATGSEDKTIKIWPTTPRSQGKADVPDRSLKLPEGVIGVIWHPKEPHTLLTATSDKSSQIQVWDTKTGQAQTTKLDVTLSTLAWASDGSILVYANFTSGEVVFLKGRTMQPLKRLTQKGEADEVNALRFSWDGTLFFKAGDPHIKVYEWPSLEPLHALRGHTFPPTVLAISRNDRYMASCASDAVIMVWDLDTMTSIWAVTRIANELTSLSFSADSLYLAYCEEGVKSISIVAAATGAHIHTIPCQDPPTFLSWSPVQPVLAWGGHMDPSSRREWYSATIWSPS